MPRVALVTGGSGALGQAIVHRFLRDGDTVCVPYIVDAERARLESSLDAATRPRVMLERCDVTDAASLGIVLLVIAILYVNSNMIYTNPVLNIAGYHIFEIQDSDGKTTALICKRAYVRTGSEIDVITVGDYVMLEKQ